MDRDDYHAAVAMPKHRVAARLAVQSESDFGQCLDQTQAREAR